MDEMKVLDLFCGRGGWSVPFIEDGDEVIGIDVENHAYPGELIIQDIRQLDGSLFKGFDLVIGSPPCTYYSKAFRIHAIRGRYRNLREANELVNQFKRVVAEAQPRYWAMENVDQLPIFYPDHGMPECWRFKVSIGGFRILWGNIPLALVVDDPFYKKRHLSKLTGSSKRAVIPYPIACVVRDAVKARSLI